MPISIAVSSPIVIWLFFLGLFNCVHVNFYCRESGDNELTSGSKRNPFKASFVTFAWTD
jgi:hypothetical protein